jgi:riboflavin synthase
VFTGLIQALGTIKPAGTDQLEVLCASADCGAILHDLAPGDSVAVDGICLTVVEIHSQGFVATASPETLRRTTLGNRHASNAPVNLETSLRAGSKLGGHFVTGHVDGTGCLQESVQTGSSWEMSFTAPAEIARYIVPKGSIAINGVSLTVAECDPTGSRFKVAVIPHTYIQTNLQHLQPGSSVNLEGDILGKYAEKFLHLGSRSLPTETPAPWGDDITPAFLAEHGFV